MVMKTIFPYWLGFFLFWIPFGHTQVFSQTISDSDWLEIHATQPHVEKNPPELRASIPVSLLHRILEATPDSFQQKGIEMGFDFHKIADRVSGLGISESFDYQSEGTLLTVRKTTRLNAGRAQAVILKFGNAFGMRFSLLTVSRIAQFISSKMGAFRGKEKEIVEVIQAARNLPPGNYLEATDGKQRYEIELQ